MKRHMLRFCRFSVCRGPIPLLPTDRHTNTHTQQPPPHSHTHTRTCYWQIKMQIGSVAQRALDGDRGNATQACTKRLTCRHPLIGARIPHSPTAFDSFEHCTAPGLLFHPTDTHNTRAHAHTHSYAHWTPGP